MSLDRQESTNAAAPGPRTVAVPRWDTSNRPTAVRTAVCSANTPPPAYSIGIDQPLKSASLAPAATCRSCNGEVSWVTEGTLAGLLRSDRASYDLRHRPAPQEADRRCGGGRRGEGTRGPAAHPGRRGRGPAARRTPAAGPGRPRGPGRRRRGHPAAVVRAGTLPCR